MESTNNIGNKDFAYRLLTFAGILLVLFVLFKYLLPFFIPFVIAAIIAFVNEPLIKLLNKKLLIPRKIASFLSLLFTITLFGLLIAVGTCKIYRELKDLQNILSNYLRRISENAGLLEYIKYLSKNFSTSGRIEGAPKALNDFLSWVYAFYNGLPDVVSNAIDDTLKGLLPQVQNIVASLAGGIFNTVTSIPKLAVYVILTILSSYFISSDKQEISEFIRRQLSKKHFERFSSIKKDIFFDMLEYVKSILVLMSITFLVVLIGLQILRVDYALLIAIVASIGEVIPFIGTGIIMVPWIIWNIVSGSYIMALGLGVIYILIIIFRHVIKPKVMGRRIGIHPLLTLMSMYIGLGVFGIPGLALGPLSMVIIKNLQASGIINIVNEPR